MIAICILNYIVALFCFYSGLKEKDKGEHLLAIVFGVGMVLNLFAGTVNLLPYLNQ